MLKGVLKAEQNDYRINMTKEIEEEVEIMCNLSQGIKEEGRIEGRAEEKAAIARNLKSLGLSPEQIAKATGLTEAEIDQLTTDHQ